VLAGTFMHEFGHSLGLTHGGFITTHKAAMSYGRGQLQTELPERDDYLFQVDLPGMVTPDYPGRL